MKNSAKHNKQAGLTLIGVLMSIMVFGLGMVALMHLLLQTLSLHASNRQLLEARGLAMEGIEIVRNIRDSNWEQNYPWDKLIGKFPIACYTDPSAIKQPNPGEFYIYKTFPDKDCPWLLDPAGVPPMRTDSNFMYQTQVGGLEKYHRFLTFSYLDTANIPTPTPTDRLLVESTVYWYQQGRIKHVDLQTVLTDWRDI